MRKIGVVGGFAAGAVLALAPLASAETFDFSDVTQHEISSMNFLFQTEAALSGVDSDDIISHTGSFDTIDPGNVNNTFASLLYGLNPADNISSDPGSYSLFNGATIQFHDAFNVLLYAGMNNGDLIDADSLIGSTTSINAVLADADGSFLSAFTTFFEAGVNDMTGFFDLPSLFS